MSSYNPPIPPRPPSVGNPQMLSSVPPPPPLPPHPPSFRQNGQSMDYSSPPHFEQPMAAPKPHRLDPSIPANVCYVFSVFVGMPILPYVLSRWHAPSRPAPIHSSQITAGSHLCHPHLQLG